MPGGRSRSRGSCCSSSPRPAGSAEPTPVHATGWLRAACDLLHERVPDQPSLTELAAAVGRHPTHLARAFRREHGLTVAEYSRSLRLDWACTQLTVGDTALSRIAIDAGFSRSEPLHPGLPTASRHHTGPLPGARSPLKRRPAEGRTRPPQVASSASSNLQVASLEEERKAHHGMVGAVLRGRSRPAGADRRGHVGRSVRPFPVVLRLEPHVQADERLPGAPSMSPPTQTWFPMMTAQCKDPLTWSSTPSRTCV